MTINELNIKFQNDGTILSMDIVDPQDNIPQTFEQRIMMKTIEKIIVELNKFKQIVEENENNWDGKLDTPCNCVNIKGLITADNFAKLASKMIFPNGYGNIIVRSPHNSISYYFHIYLIEDKIKELIIGTEA